MQFGNGEQTSLVPLDPPADLISEHPQRRGSFFEHAIFANPRGIVVQEEGGLVVTEAHTAPRRLTYGAPAITSITPQTIDSRGGETVSVKGRNFSSETIVVLAGTLIFRAPKLPSGKATLTLQNRGGIGQAPIVLKPVPLNALAIGAITTIAGSSTFAGDGGPAFAASLSGPTDVKFDLTGNMLIADSGNHRIRRISAADGRITTIAGNGSHGFDGDFGPPSEATLTNPSNVAVDRLGNIFISDSGNSIVRRIDADLKSIRTVIVRIDVYSTPVGCVCDNPTSLFV
jgi:hypothetical protein